MEVAWNWGRGLKSKKHLRVKPAMLGVVLMTEHRSAETEMSLLVAENNKLVEENKRLHAALIEALRMIKHSCHTHNGRCGRCENDEKTLYEIVRGNI